MDDNFHAVSSIHAKGRPFQSLGISVSVSVGKLPHDVVAVVLFSFFKAASHCHVPCNTVLLQT